MAAGGDGAAAAAAAAADGGGAAANTGPPPRIGFSLYYIDPDLVGGGREKLYSHFKQRFYTSVITNSSSYGGNYLEDIFPAQAIDSVRIVAFSADTPRFDENNICKHIAGSLANYLLKTFPSEISHPPGSLTCWNFDAMNWILSKNPVITSRCLKLLQFGTFDDFFDYYLFLAANSTGQVALETERWRSCLLPEKFRPENCPNYEKMQEFREKLINVFCRNLIRSIVTNMTEGRVGDVTIDIIPCREYGFGNPT